MRVYRVRSIKVWTGSRASANGFVILVLPVAEREVVHGALRIRQDSQRGIECIGNDLTGLHVTGDNGSRRPGIQQASIWNVYLDRAQAAVIEGDFLINQCPKYIKHGRPADRGGCVEIGGQLPARAGEIDTSAPFFLVDSNFNDDRAAVIHGASGFTSMQTCNGAPNRLRGVVLHMAHIGAYNVKAILPTDNP